MCDMSWPTEKTAGNWRLFEPVCCVLLSSTGFDLLESFRSISFCYWSLFFLAFSASPVTLLTHPVRISLQRTAVIIFVSMVLESSHA